MKNITTVKELSGKFFVETKNGEIFELKIGDTIRENDIVFGSETNQAGSKIDEIVNLVRTETALYTSRRDALSGT